VKTVLSLCDRTGVMVQPWLEAGYPCVIVDLQHPAGVHTDGLLTRVGADVASYLPPRVEYAAAFAFPPCTHLASSGARWFQDKGLAALAEGILLVEACRRILEWTDAPWALENPNGTLSTYWRQPDFSFDPYEYAGWSDGAEAYTKRTCLWTGGGFTMPPRKPVEPVDGSKMHRLGPSPERANLRSVTPEGFARAVFAANHGEGLTERYRHEGQPDLFGGAA
jgi:hypothetical protein